MIPSVAAASAQRTMKVSYARTAQRPLDSSDHHAKHFQRSGTLHPKSAQTWEVWC